MKRLKYSIGVRSVKVINILLITAAFALAWFLHYTNCGAHKALGIRGEIVLVCLFMFLYIMFTRVYDAFMISASRISEMIFSQVLSAAISDAVMFIVVWLVIPDFPHIYPMLIVFGAQIITSVLWCVIAHKLYFAILPPRRSAVIYDSREGFEHLISEYGLQKRFKVELVIKDDECLDNIECIKGMETVFLSGVSSSNRNDILKYCIANDIQVYMIPLVGDVLVSAAKQRHILHLPMLRTERYNPSPEYLFIKRLFDIVSSLAVLILVSPIMIITAIAIKLCDWGPVFYKQKRLTKDGKEFNVLKFRSMRVDAEKDGVARLSTGTKDSRVTPIGRIIRKFRIDEFPQLFNILGGSMSVVGPRPERPEIAAQYEEELPEFRLRLQAKAGLTGYAQVYGKYNTTPIDKLRMDLMYISKPSFLTDLSLIFATVKILFVPESTEGVAEGQVTASGSVEKKEKQTV
ncbi:MAG: exopolysaccharide biosynthesis polyprenyl glycosylphosphotransferase [Ruminococcaceae bacterium]|nr:exopolysaccharide biosynthesis polyprenyl glycosylphosphotransferase [Oscillospiraceae bacterium]